ncbi:MAG: SRPBCC family protein [Acidimicrobiales bacterium]
MRASQRRQRIIEVSADRAWAVIGRPEVLHHWFPGIDACEVDDNTRTITTGIGLALVEDIVTNDPLQRRFQYKIAGGFFKEHLASIDVIELGPDRCLVTYASDADPATMAIVLGGAMEGALAELARQLEADAGPVIDALRKES